MEETVSSPFLEVWTQIMIVGAIAMLLAGIAVYLFHHLKVASIKDHKAKYDFISTREIKNYKLVFLFFGLSALMAINLYGMGQNLKMGLWFFIRLFISVSGGTLVVYVAYLVLEYYYPTVLHRKLLKWRYTPRRSSSGNEMRLLSEEEEDVHLEEGMRAEEHVFSIDYDVWMDEKTREVKVEKYAGHLQALQCNSCGFYTMRVVKEEITRQPSKNAPGELIKHYQCQYCKAGRATAFNISTKEAEDYKKPSAIPPMVKKKNHVDLVRVEIHSALSGKKFYEFPSLDQTLRFLEGYDPEK